MFSEKLQTVLKVIAVLLIFCILGVGIYMLDKILTPKKGKADTFNEARKNLTAVDYNGVKYMRKSVETYLIVGVDKNSGSIQYHPFRNSKQSDFIMLLVVDKSTREITAINLNRDTITEVDELGFEGYNVGTRNMHLALAYTYGDGKQQSAENLRRAVQRLLTSPFDAKIQKYNMVDHYMVMTMDAVEVFTDYINNNAKSDAEKILIDIGEDEDLTSINETWTPGSKDVVVEGKDALKLVRGRMELGDGTNEGRMGRQSRYIVALSKAIGSKKWDYKYLSGMLEALSDNKNGNDDMIITDYGKVEQLYDDLNELFEMFGFYEYGEVIDIVSDSNGVNYGVNKVEEWEGQTVNAFYIETEEQKAAFTELILKTFYRKMEY